MDNINANIKFEVDIMGKIRELLVGFEYEIVQGDIDRDYSEFVTDNRKVTKDSVFICIAGANFDGHSVAGDVCEKGACAVVVEKDVEVPDDVTVIKVASTRAAMAYISAAYYDFPAKSLTTIGITGTKGKTTTTYLIKSILEQSGRKVGLIGTIEAIIGDKHIKANNTTPESTVIQKYMRQMVDCGCDCVVMEVSSQGLMLHRTLGITFDIGIFTNLEPDHIGPNEHDSFEHYMQCKSLLFRQCKMGIVNGDDEHVEKVIAGHTCEIEKYGMSDGLDYVAQNLSFVSESGKLGMMFDVTGKCDFTAKINMPGKFSVYNALCAIAVCKNLGISNEVIKEVLPKGFVKGRIEMIDVSNDYTLMIDYAHNAMALESLLVTLKEYNPGRIVTLFGCGGNRAKSRRYEMGEVSGRLSDLTVITSDNPRNEEPLDIIADIRTGIDKTDGEYIEIPDRKEAIRYCILNGKPGDIIVLAGKGHEDYQEICGVKHPMDERVLIEEIMKEEGLK